MLCNFFWSVFRNSADCFLGLISLSSCVCFLGDRVGTGWGNQEVVSEQRQNRGNLNHNPNYSTSCQHSRAYSEAILISPSKTVLVCLLGGHCPGQLLQSLQSRCVFFLAVKREKKRETRKKMKENERKCAKQRLWWQRSNLYSNISENCCEQFSYLGYFCKNGVQHHNFLPHKVKSDAKCTNQFSGNPTL